MSAVMQLIGELLAVLVILSLATLALVEFLGARVPGFYTISDATRNAVAKGDYRLFVAVSVLLLVTAAWWPVHIFFKGTGL